MRLTDCTRIIIKTSVFDEAIVTAQLFGRGCRHMESILNCTAGLTMLLIVPESSKLVGWKS